MLAIFKNIMYTVGAIPRDIATDLKINMEYYFQINKNITTFCCIKITILQVCQNISNTCY